MYAPHDHTNKITRLKPPGTADPQLGAFALHSLHHPKNPTGKKRPQRESIADC